MTQRLNKRSKYFLDRKHVIVDFRSFQFSEKTSTLRTEKERFTQPKTEWDELNVVWQPGWKGAWGEMDTCICMPESLCCHLKLSQHCSLIGSVLVTQLCPAPCDPWTIAHQPPLFTEFSRQEYWSGLPFPSPGDLPDPGIEAGSPALQANSLPSEPPGKPPIQNKKFFFFF